MDLIKDLFLDEFASEYYWIGIYKRETNKARRLSFAGPLPPCHEFEFGRGNVGLTATTGIRKVISDVSLDSQYSQCFLPVASELVEPIYYEDQLVGVVDVESDKKDFFTEERCKSINSLAKRVAPILVGSNLDYNLKILEWVNEARKIAPNICNWVGVYYKSSYIFNEDSADLVVGPYLGELTDHVRIPINSGLCGMALREERVINEADISNSDSHIACSLSTRSELVIPLKDSDGNYVAELDVDSDKESAFDSSLEQRFIDFSKTFPIYK
jgi:L-methionine (R)-S-oxide reductase